MVIWQQGLLMGHICTWKMFIFSTRSLQGRQFCYRALYCRSSLAASPCSCTGGTAMGGVNVEGIRYYNNLINELISNGTYSVGGYAMGFIAPGRCSPGDAANCLGGDSSEEPYIVSHNQLLAHAAAVKLYRDKYQVYQKGKIGISLVSNWVIPYSESKEDHDAANRALDFIYGWFMDPLTNGDYPVSMRSLVGVRLPRFTLKQSMMVNGSFDFIGLNYYTSNYAANSQAVSRGNLSYNTDSSTNQTVSRNGVLIGPRAASTWLYVYPRGIRDILIYTKSRYNNPTIYITENGVDEINNKSLSLGEALNDTARIDYYHQHLLNVQSAIGQGANVKGYFAWSLLDNFEWMDGYTVRFGINFVDYENGLKRYPKNSSLWFRKFLEKHM